MKHLKYLFLALVLSLGVNALTSCNLWDDKEADLDPGDLIVDWAPAELYITVEDSYGNDLLDTLSNSCIVDHITATFCGDTLKVRKTSDGYREEISDSTGTRTLLPTWYGLCLINHKPVWNGKQWNWEKTDKFMLYLGEISGSHYYDEDIVLHWGNGKTSTIHYHCSDFIVTKKEQSRDLWFSVDGKKQTSNSFKFVF